MLILTPHWGTRGQRGQGRRGWGIDFLGCGFEEGRGGGGMERRERESGGREGGRGRQEGGEGGKPHV